MTIQRFSPTRFTTTALLCGLVALAACDEAPVRPAFTDSAADVSLEISTLAAGAGEQVALALRTESRTRSPVGAFQGRLTFNPSRLRYVGQAQATDAFVLVNDRQAAAGELRILGTDIDGFESLLQAAVPVVDGISVGLC